jgi:hypothetical protein
MLPFFFPPTYPIKILTKRTKVEREKDGSLNHFAFILISFSNSENNYYFDHDRIYGGDHTTNREEVVVTTLTLDLIIICLKTRSSNIDQSLLV